MIGRSGERGLGISVLAARHDDDDDDRFINNVKNVILDILESLIIFLSVYLPFKEIYKM